MSNKHNLPDILPLFPLSGVLLLPHGQLPLNIFEPRYLAMVDDALKTDLRMIGMIQPDFLIGCAGRISAFQETDDGRYLITLNGIARFRIKNELPQISGYRRVQPNWQGFEDDINRRDPLDVDRAALTKVLKVYFSQHGLSMDWDIIDVVADERLMVSLAMICPLEAAEKQALLEAPCCKSRADLLFKLLTMAVRGYDEANTAH
jgi:uncharacterized protein